MNPKTLSLFRGTPRRLVPHLLAVLLTVSSFAYAQTLECATVSKGGGVTGNASLLIVGQPMVGVMSNAQYTIELGAVPCLACTPRAFGDIVPPYEGNGLVDVDDILCVLDGFIGVPPCDVLADIFPCGGNGLIDVDDILAMLDAFSGTPACPDPCL